MARKLGFKSQMAKCLEKNDASNFQSLISNKLVEKLNIKKIDIVSEMLAESDSETQIVTQLAAMAASYGGNDAVYDLGVMDIRFNDPQAIKNFTEQLDQIEGVEYYEIHTPRVSVENNTGGTDLEYQGNKPIFEVAIFLDMDAISLPSDIDAYIKGLDQFEEEYLMAANKKRINEKECDDEDDDSEEDEDDDSEEDEDDSEEDEDDDSEEDEDDDSEEDEDDVKKESLQFSTILDKVALHEFLTIKTAHWNQALKKATTSTDKICPPGKTGPDCKTILTAQQKMAMRKRMISHLKKMSGTKRKLMSTHASATRAFIKQHNLMSKSAAKAKLGK